MGLVSYTYRHCYHACYKFKNHNHICAFCFVDFYVGSEIFYHRTFTATAGAVTEQSAQSSDWRSKGNDASTQFREGLLKGIPLDCDAYASLLQDCTDMKTLKQLHARMYTTGLEQNIFLESKLASIYVMCGCMGDARLIFDKQSQSNAFLWNVMIRGYSKNGPCEEALKLYYRMQRKGIPPDKFTFPFVLKACARLSALEEGKEIHDDIVRSGFGADVFVGSALIHMYAKCGSIEVARQVFDKMSERDVVSWNAMVVGYAQNGYANETLALFHQMQLADVTPDPFTVVSVLQACACLGALRQGKWIHDYIIRCRFEADVFVGTALIDMYAKCRRIDLAFQVFDKMSRKDAVLWNAMIAGCAQNGHADEALMLLNQMQLAGIKPNSVTMVNVLPACTQLAALQKGKWIHSYIIRRGFESDVFVGTALIDMYAKCGSIELARQFFDKMPKRDVVSWNAMIVGYGMHGHGEDALALFSQMQQAGMKANHITFVCILSACSHAGLVYEGWDCFDCMSRHYCITPRMEHYACMVDLLGRAGCLDEAEDFIKKMPLKPGASVWGALLGACKIHRNVELGERVAECLLESDPKNIGSYLLLSNIYAMAGRWDDVEKVRIMMKNRGLKKTPGCSLIEVNNRVHAFLVGDRSHPQSEKIYAKLGTLAGQMKEAGYVPNTNFVLHDVEEEMKEHTLCSHSEKLAIAFGLINTSPGTPIRITKNLRVCDDCHSATKFISKLAMREIIVRDANRFHHFKDGLCSCRDYW